VVFRFVEKNRRDVEEKSEQLRAMSNLATIFVGFAIVTLTQFNVQENNSQECIDCSCKEKREIHKNVWKKPKNR